MHCALNTESAHSNIRMYIISNKNKIKMQFHCVVRKVHDLKDSG